MPARKGEKNHNAKLTDEERILICKTYKKNKIGYRTLAKKFNVHAHTIRYLVQNPPEIPSNKPVEIINGSSRIVSFGTSFPKPKNGRSRENA